MLAVAIAMAGCQSRMSRTDSPAPVTSSPTSAARTGPGLNSDGEVTNSKLVEAGSGRKVKGLGDWEGEITGKPDPNSNFSKLEIGMPMRQVIDLIGQPTDQGAYITGKAFIPFYFGSDRYRHEMVFKGRGRLIFAGGGIGDFMSGHLVWIIHSATEGGYR